VTGRLGFRCASVEFSASFGVTALTLLLAAMLVSLGVWQLERGWYKEALEDLHRARTNDEAVRLSAPINDAEALRYRRVVLRGRYDPAHLVLLDNRVQAGRVGYEVFSPLLLETPGLWLLIDRGWVPQGETRVQLPEVTTPTGVTELAGLLDFPPGKTLTLGETETPGWPKVVQHVDLRQLSQRLGHPLQPMVVLLDARAPFGFLRRWQVTPMGAGRHFAYAVQWFAMAVVLLLLYGLLHSHRASPATSDGHAAPASPER
jgi:surfeit locus 1 family protein